MKNNIIAASVITLMLGSVYSGFWEEVNTVFEGKNVDKRQSDSIKMLYTIVEKKASKEEVKISNVKDSVKFNQILTEIKYNRMVAKDIKEVVHDLSDKFDQFNYNMTIAGKKDTMPLPCNELVFNE